MMVVLMALAGHHRVLCMYAYLYIYTEAPPLPHASGGSVLTLGDDLVTNDWEEEDPFISSNV